MNFEEIEKFLLLEKNVERLDSTGLTNIKKDSICWFNRLDEYCKKRKLTPIERIMKIILIFVDDRLREQLLNDFNPCIISNCQKGIGKYRADFEVELVGTPIKYIIECDGHEFHEKTKEQAKYDKQRERYFIKCGYRVLRYSGSEIYNDFHKIIDELVELFLVDLEGNDD